VRISAKCQSARVIHHWMGRQATCEWIDGLPLAQDGYPELSASPTDRRWRPERSVSKNSSRMTSSRTRACRSKTSIVLVVSQRRRLWRLISGTLMGLCRCMMRSFSYSIRTIVNILFSRGRWSEHGSVPSVSSGRNLPSRERWGNERIWCDSDIKDHGQKKRTEGQATGGWTAGACESRRWSV